MVGILIQEIQRAPNWHHAKSACDAIFHVRLKQVSLERESCTHFGMGTSPWTPDDARPRDGMTQAVPKTEEADRDR